MSDLLKRVVWERDGQCSVHYYRLMRREDRPQDPHLDGTGLTFRTLDHGGEYPDTMPQAILLTDAEGRTCTYLPAEVDGKIVKSSYFAIEGGAGDEVTVALREREQRED